MILLRSPGDEVERPVVRVRSAGTCDLVVAAFHLRIAANYRIHMCARAPTTAGGVAEAQGHFVARQEPAPMGLNGKIHESEAARLCSRARELLASFGIDDERYDVGPEVILTERAGTMGCIHHLRHAVAEPRIGIDTDELHDLFAVTVRQHAPFRAAGDMQQRIPCERRHHAMLAALLGEIHQLGYGTGDNDAPAAKPRGHIVEERMRALLALGLLLLKCIAARE